MSVPVCEHPETVYLPRYAIYPRRVRRGELAGNRTEPVRHEIPALLVE